MYRESGNEYVESISTFDRYKEQFEGHTSVQTVVISFSSDKDQLGIEKESNEESVSTLVCCHDHSL